jgi:4-amino-4-deoxy-L-arabinose transferase-like glycosyltransferase
MAYVGDALHALLFVTRHLMTAVLLTISALLCGRRVVARLTADALETWLLGTTLGLVVLADAGFLLALGGRLAATPLLGLVALVHLASRSWWRSALHGARALLRRDGAARLLAVAVAAVAPFFVMALYPPTAFDATLYHLPFARAFAASGRLPFLPDLRFPVFPQLNEVLFAEVLLVAPDIDAHLVALVATLLCAGIVFTWGRAAFSAGVGALAAAIYLGNPLVAYLGTTGYVEALATLLGTAALYCAWRWWESPDGAWLLLAGVFAGSAASVKYLGLFFVLASAGVIAFRRRGSRAADVAMFVAAATIAAAPWYGRILFHTGNPVFPFLSEIFGANAWDPDHLVSPRATLAGGGHVLPFLLTLPFDAVFDRAKTGLVPPLSPVYLLVTPLLVVEAWRDRRVRRLLGVACAYLLLLPLLPHDARYVVPILPLTSLAVAASTRRTVAALAACVRVRRASVLTAIALLCFAPGWLYGWYRAARQGPVPLDHAAREAYLARELPAYGAVQYLNRTHGADYTVYALFAENLPYLAEGRFIGDVFGPARFALVVPLLSDPEALAHTLEALGADYLLIARDHAPLHVNDELRAPQHFQMVYSDAHSDLFRLRSRMRSIPQQPR